uniref:C-type lectin domain-containing protein n=1 Tax=Steinernema glaseri TaxID=37863 RepID=A0A1I7ZDX1_9BILA
MMFLVLAVLFHVAASLQHPLTVLRLRHEIASYPKQISSAKVTLEGCVDLTEEHKKEEDGRFLHMVRTHAFSVEIPSVGWSQRLLPGMMFLVLAVLFHMAASLQPPLTVLRLRHEIASYPKQISTAKVTLEGCVDLVLKNGTQRAFFVYDQDTGHCKLHERIRSSTKTQKLTKNYFVSVDGSDVKKAFMGECESDACPVGWKLFTGNNQCYGLLRIRKSRDKSNENYGNTLRTLCSSGQSTSTGQPASIHNQEEQNFIANLLDEQNGIEAALGLTRLPLPHDQSNNWKWVDNSSVDFNGWEDGQEEDKEMIVAVMSSPSWKWQSMGQYIGYYVCTIKMCDFEDEEKEQCSA